MLVLYFADNEKDTVIKMESSEILRLSALADVIGHKYLTHAQQKELILKAGIENSTFYPELELGSAFVKIWRGNDSFSDMASLHSHSFYEIICCTDGGAQYLLETARCHIVQGDILVIPPGISHRRLPLLPEQPHTIYGRYGIWVNAVHLEQLEQSFSGLCLLKKPRILRVKDVETKDLAEHLFRAWKENEENMYLSQAAVYGEAILFLTKLCRAVNDFSQEKPLRLEARQDILDKILIYIDENLSGKITLAGVARCFFVSESYITHQFRHEIGMSFYQYVIQRRLNFARTLIEKGESMEHAAQSAGFCGYSNFYRAFLKEYGIAPSGYRKLWQGTDILEPQ